MYCRNCGVKLEENIAKCENCGTEVIKSQDPPLVPAKKIFTQKQIWISAAAAIAVILILILANQGSSSSPEATVKQFIKAVDNHDSNGIISVISQEYRPQMVEMSDAKKSLKESLDNEGIRVKNYRILQVEKDENHATVSYQVDVESKNQDLKQEKDTMRLIKIDGKWYIDQDLNF